MSSKTIKSLESEQLKEWILSGQKGILIVDVRDEDFEGGNIKFALNIPSEE